MALPTDAEMISKQEHELNYVLNKFGKRSTQANRDGLSAILDNFRTIEKYKPHHRKEFYQFIDDTDALKDLENKA